MTKSKHLLNQDKGSIRLLVPLGFQARDSHIKVSIQQLHQHTWLQFQAHLGIQGLAIIYAYFSHKK
jgi:hypothetical protein